jgi:toxin ParE1/3/4
MARRLRWSPRALDDLDDILAYIARDSPFYARAVHDRFLQRVAALPDQPGQGRRVPEYKGSDDVREVFVHGWRIIYRTSDDAVRIVTIVHGARLLKSFPPI